MTLVLENNVLTGSDGGYTNGAAFEWGRGPFDDLNAELPRWMQSLVDGLNISNLRDRRFAVSFLIAQTMNTPEDIAKESLTPDDAPYVGMLFWQGIYHAFNERTLNRFSLSVGTVGPAAGAGDAQRFVHALTSSTEPRGWDEQISNEPVFRIATERYRRIGVLVLSEGRAADFIGFDYAGAGTMRSEFGAGFTVRYGARLADSFSMVSHLPGRRLDVGTGHPSSWHLFLTVAGEYVANDIRYDGNTFKDSHSVPLEHVQARAEFGFVYSRGAWSYALSAVAMTDQYKAQKVDTKFGILAITYRR